MSCEGFPKHPDKRVVNSLLLKEDGSGGMAPEEAVSYNQESASDFLIKNGSLKVFPEEPGSALPKSSDKPLPKAA